MTFIRHLISLSGCNPLAPLAPLAPKARGGWRRKLSVRTPLSPYRNPQGLTEGPTPVRAKVKAEARALQPNTNLRGSPSARRISLYINLGAGLVGAAGALFASSFVSRPLWGSAVVVLAVAGACLLVVYTRRKKPGTYRYRRPWRWRWILTTLSLVPQFLAYVSLMGFLYGVCRGLEVDSTFAMVSVALLYIGFYAMVSRALYFVGTARIGGVRTAKIELLAGGAALICLGFFLRFAQLLVAMIFRPKDDWLLLLGGWGGLTIVAALIGGLVAILVGLPRRGVNKTGGALRGREGALPQTWTGDLKRYEALCKTRPLSTLWRGVMQLEPLPSDLRSEVYYVNGAKFPVELENPEWPILARRAKLNFIASSLASVGSLESLMPALPPKIADADLSLTTLVEDVLLLQYGKELNGQGEFLISFAFLSAEAARVRDLDGGFWGPLYAFRRLFRSDGGLLRELWMASLLWLAALGLVMLPCLWARGPVCRLLSLAFILAGLAGAWVAKESTESWLDEGLWGAMPPGYPVRMQRRPHRYTAYKDGRRSPTLILAMFFFLRLAKPRVASQVEGDSKEAELIPHALS